MPRDAVEPRATGLHRDVLDQLPRCFIKLEASGDGLRSAIQQPQPFVEGPANYAFHCTVRNAFGLAVLTSSQTTVERLLCHPASGLNVAASCQSQGRSKEPVSGVSVGASQSRN